MDGGREEGFGCQPSKSQMTDGTSQPVTSQEAIREWGCRRLTRVSSVSSCLDCILVIAHLPSNNKLLRTEDYLVRTNLASPVFICCPCLVGISWDPDNGPGCYRSGLALAVWHWQSEPPCDACRCCCCESKTRDGRAENGRACTRTSTRTSRRMDEPLLLVSQSVQVSIRG
jgi:hypothetical protein